MVTSYSMLKGLQDCDDVWQNNLQIEPKIGNLMHRFYYGKVLEDISPVSIMSLSSTLHLAMRVKDPTHEAILLTSHVVRNCAALCITQSAGLFTSNYCGRHFCTA